MGPRFHTKLHSSWGRRVEGEDGWKSCCMPVTWLTSHQDYCLYMQWRELFKNLKPNVMPKIWACCCFLLVTKNVTGSSNSKLFSMGKSLSAINKPQSFQFTSLHICFSWILLQLCDHISVRIQLLVGMQQASLEDRCADDYCKETHTHSCLSAFSVVMRMGFAFALQLPWLQACTVLRINCIFSLFHACWMLLFRFFRSIRKSWNFLHIPQQKILALIPCFKN